MARETITPQNENPLSVYHATQDEDQRALISNTQIVAVVEGKATQASVRQITELVRTQQQGFRPEAIVGLTTDNLIAVINAFPTMKDVNEDAEDGQEELVNLIRQRAARRRERDAKNDRPTQQINKAFEAITQDDEFAVKYEAFAEVVDRLTEDLSPAEQQLLAYVIEKTWTKEILTELIINNPDSFLRLLENKSLFDQNFRRMLSAAETELAKDQPLNPTEEE